jgi:malonate transporter
MPEIIGITAPIFIIMGIGYLCVKTNTIAKSVISGMGFYVIYCALPALLIQSLADLSLGDIFNVRYLGVYGGGTAIAFLLSFTLARYIRKKPIEDSAFQGLGASLPNSAFVGYAMLTPLFGKIAVIGVALSMLFDLIVTIPAAIALSESGKNTSTRKRKVVIQVFLNTLKNPLVIAIGVGIFLAIGEISIPPIIQKVTSLLANSAAAISLFVIGGALAGCTIKGKLLDIGQLSFFKLIVHPLLVTLAVVLLPAFDPKLQATVILLAAMPMAGIFPIIGQPYKQEEICATALVAATLLSFITLNLAMLVLLKMNMLG